MATPSMSSSYPITSRRRTSNDDLPLVTLRIVARRRRPVHDTDTLGLASVVGDQPPILTLFLPLGQRFEDQLELSANRRPIRQTIPAPRAPTTRCDTKASIVSHPPRLVNDQRRGKYGTMRAMANEVMIGLGRDRGSRSDSGDPKLDPDDDPSWHTCHGTRSRSNSSRSCLMRWRTR